MQSDSSLTLPIFTTSGITDSEKNADLAVYLIELLEQKRNAWEGNWRGDNPLRTMSNTCQVVEAIHLTSLPYLSKKLVNPAAKWLVDLPLLRGLSPDDHRRVRIYPSRFKVLSMLGIFKGQALQADLAELGDCLDPESGLLLNVEAEDLKPGIAGLVTLTWLDALGYLESGGQDISSWRAGREIVLDALTAAFKHWLDPTSPANRFLISNEGDASYALDLLLRNLRLTPDSEPAQNAISKLLDTIRRPRSGGMRNSDFIYCGIQLSAQCANDKLVQDTVRAFIRQVRERYVSNGYAREHISFHALVLRLLASSYGAELPELIFETQWTQRREAAKQQQTVETERQGKELAKLIQGGFEISIGNVESLSGPRSRNEVFRVHFGFRTEAADEQGNQMSLPNDQLRLIVKRGRLQSLLDTIASYAELPEELKEYFARHTTTPHAVSGNPLQPWYLVLEDLAQWKPLGEELERIDGSAPGREENKQLARMVGAVGKGLQAIHSRRSPGTGVSDELQRLYILPITERLDRLCDPKAHPSFKRCLTGRIEANGHLYKTLGFYLAALRTHDKYLRPPHVGLIHGDCHSRNLLLNADLDMVKFVDLENMNQNQDYLVDYALLLEDVALYRLLADQDPRRRIGLDDIQVRLPGDESPHSGEHIRFPIVRYPALPLDSQLILEFEHALLQVIEQYADSIEDEHWKPRLWLAVARALALLASRQLIGKTLEHHRQTNDLRIVLLIYSEIIRLLSELVDHFKLGVPLEAVPFRGG